jgi:hypothetical protein
MADYFVNIKLDAENKQIILNVVDSTGVIQSDWGEIALTLGKDPGTTPTQPGTTMGEDIALRETKGCDDEGNPVYCMLPRSTWYSTPKTSNPEV